MLELTLVVAGVVVGAAVAAFVVRGQVTASASRERAALDSRLAVAETMEKELQKQLTERQLEIGDLRAALERERVERAQAETRSEAARESLEAERRLLEGARERLGDTFKALSADALRQSNTQFLELAQKTLEAQFGPREAALKDLVQPLADSLTRYEKQIREVEAARQDAYGSLREQLRSLSVASEQLQRETGTLVTALSRSSQARGRWGEITLRRVIELSGMTARCDFSEQVTADTEAGRVRPDVVVHLPDKREIVIDAKAPLSAYFEALAATRPEDRQAAIARHAQQLRLHMTQLAGKTYWADFPAACDFVVMFIPGESFFGAAIEADAALIEDAMARRIVLATPTTLIALLLAVHHGWRQAQMAESAKKISDLGKDLYDRVRTLGRHFEKMRKGLVQATEAYNDAAGSLERRVLPAARKFEELGAASGDAIAVVEPIDQQPRAVTAPELLVQDPLPELNP
ncbi:MAG: DNA recombination protein RmuC [Candidatus Rokubacteria bacterium]|nr:DNA recombination protein RmuC [Candidatus Rokubacteria bacterium]